MAVVAEIVDFLRRFPPFNELDPETVEQLSETVEVEFHAAGSIIFAKGTQPVEVLRVIRAGAVEVVNDGQVLDLMGPGELFGHASMLSGLPPGFEARAAEETLDIPNPGRRRRTSLQRPPGPSLRDPGSARGPAPLAHWSAPRCRARPTPSAGSWSDPF